jgi:GT2 family glycosyltransferase
MGGFDERFFMYYEDVDLSFRAHLAGWKSVYLADIAVKHLGGGTTASIQGRRLFYSMRSRVIYIGKHFGGLKAGLVLLGILLLEFPVRMILSLLRLSFVDLLNTIKALGLLLINLPAMFKAYEK